MKPGAGKNKGSSFERKVAQELSLWLTGNQDRKQIIRSVLSGGWDKKDPDWRQVGDLAPNGPVGEEFRKRFSVECKHHNSIDFWKLFTGQSPLVDWWKKLNDESNNFNLIPLLIFRANNRPVLIGSVSEIIPLASSPMEITTDYPTMRLVRFDVFLKYWDWITLMEFVDEGGVTSISTNRS